MFYDLDEPAAFLRDIASILHQDGIWIVQFADLPGMLLTNMYDNICHEHVAYYHLAPIERLPIISPHGHVDPAWFAKNEPFETTFTLTGQAGTSSPSLERVLMNPVGTLAVAGCDEAQAPAQQRRV